MTESAPARLRRLGEELEEVGLRVDPSVDGRILLEEIDLALYSELEITAVDGLDVRPFLSLQQTATAMAPQLA